MPEASQNPCISRAAVAFSFIAMLGLPHHLWACGALPEIAPGLTIIYGFLPLLCLAAGTCLCRLSVFSVMETHWARPICLVTVLAASLLLALDGIDNILFHLAASSIFLYPPPVLTISVLGICALATSAELWLTVQPKTAESPQVQPEESSLRSTEENALTAPTFLCLSSGWTLFFIAGWLPQSRLPQPLLFSMPMSALLWMGLFRTTLVKMHNGDSSASQWKSSILGMVLGFGCTQVATSILFDASILSMPFLAAAIVFSVASLVRSKRNTPVANLATTPAPKRTTTDFIQTHFAEYNLTNREIDAIAGCLDGNTSAETAQKLNIAASTVRSYLQRAFKKINVANRDELVKLIQNDLPAGQAANEYIGPSEASRHSSQSESSPSSRLMRCCLLSGLITLVYLITISPISYPALESGSVLFGAAAGILQNAFFPYFAKRWSLGVFALRLGAIAYLIAAIGSMYVVPGFMTLAFSPAYTFLAMYLFSSTTLELLRLLRAATSTTSFATHRFHIGVTLIISACLCFLASIHPVAWTVTACLSVLCVLPSLIGKRSLFTVQLPPVHSTDIAPSNSSTCQDIALITLVSGVLGFSWSDLWTHTITYLTPWLTLPFSTIVVVLYIARARSLQVNRTVLGCTVASILLFALAGYIAHPYVYMLGQTGLQISAPMAAIVAFIWQCNNAQTHHCPSQTTSISACVSFSFGLLLGITVEKLIDISTFFPDAMGWSQITYNIAQESSNWTALFSVGYLFSCIALLVLHSASKENQINRLSFASREKRLLAFLYSQNLTETETSVTIEIYRGLSSLGITRKQSLSLGAVNSARRNAYYKLAVHSRRQLIELLDTAVPPTGVDSSSR